MLPGGWLRTGDIGHVDAQGYVFIEDRKKDMILVSGFNVYPNEVESVIVTHPNVLEAAAVAQADEHSGEVVAVFVVPKDPGLTEEGVIDAREAIAHRIQGAEARLHPEGTAEDECGEDLEAGAEG